MLLTVFLCVWLSEFRISSYTVVHVLYVENSLKKNHTVEPEYSDIVYNPTYFLGPLVCRIRQVPLYFFEATEVL